MIAVVAAGVVLTGLSGCARYPAVTSGATASLLTVSLQVNSTQDAQINPNYYYFIALQASPDATVSGADPSLGPFAVFQAGSGVTWGNGWGTGKISDYVLYHAGVAQQFSIDVSDPSTYLSNVINNSQVPNPVSAVPRSFSLSPDGKNLSITIDTSSLGLNAGKTPTRTPPGGVVLNVITTDKVPVGQENAVPVKAVDSLEGGGIVVLPDNTTEPLSGLPQLDLHQQKTIEIRPTGRVQDPGASDPVRLQDLQMTDIVVNVQPG